MKETILLVDDEQDILSFLSYNLKKEGFTIYLATNGLEAIEVSKKVKPDLILLDVMMPGLDGIEVCEILRKDTQLDNPIIAFLTSRSEDYSQVAGLESGADDYITKPIRPRLLISRIEALLRRKSSKKTFDPYNNENLKLDRDRFLLISNGEEIQLPRKEFELLALLLSKPEYVFTRDRILAEVWGDETIVGERTVDVHVRKLREKIGDSYIRNIKGISGTFTD